MKSISLLLLGCSIASTSLSFCAENKRPKHKPKQSSHQKTNEQEEQEEGEEKEHHYNPNPVIIAGVGQIMNGALSIAQNPHNRPNIGHSIASMIYGIMSIIVEKIAHKKIDINDPEALQECLDEICSDMSEEITEIIVKRFAALHNEEVV